MRRLVDVRSGDLRLRRALADLGPDLLRLRQRHLQRCPQRRGLLPVDQLSGRKLRDGVRNGLCRPSMRAVRGGDVRVVREPIKLLGPRRMRGRDRAARPRGAGSTADLRSVPRRYALRRRRSSEGGVRQRDMGSRRVSNDGVHREDGMHRWPVGRRRGQRNDGQDVCVLHERDVQHELERAALRKMALLRGGHLREHCRRSAMHALRRGDVHVIVEPGRVSASGSVRRRDRTRRCEHPDIADDLRAVRTGDVLSRRCHAEANVCDGHMG